MSLTVLDLIGVGIGTHVIEVSSVVSPGRFVDAVRIAGGRGGRG
jgi:hypothetical protein